MSSSEDSASGFEEEVFDRLPATSDLQHHSYLRSLRPLDSKSPRSPSGAPLLVVPGTGVLFPGESLPRRFPGSVAELLASQSIVCLAPSQAVHGQSDHVMNCATTAFIHRISEVDAASDTCDVVFVGLRKCLLVPPVDRLTGQAQVEIIVDEEPRLPKSLRYSLAFSDRLIARNYDIADLRRQIVTLLKASKPWKSVSVLPTEESCDSFSWLVGSQLCVSSAQRMQFFLLLGTTARLRFLRQTLLDEAASKPIKCRHCSTEISSSQSIFLVQQSHHVNEHGVTHSLVTLRAASRNFVAHGHASADHSYFPGYSWIIGSCGTCQHHMGWRFIAHDKDLVPQSFIALTRDSVKY